MIGAPKPTNCTFPKPSRIETTRYGSHSSRRFARVFPHWTFERSSSPEPCLETASAATALSAKKPHSIGSRPKRLSVLADSTCPESLLDLLQKLIACWQIFCHEVSSGVV